MNIIKSKVNWNESFQNYPDLELEVENVPDIKTMRYEERNGIYYAEREGYVSYFYYKNPDNGFGGREFPITMKDGTEKVLKGPWSSRAACVNNQGFGPIVDVVIQYNQYHRIACAVTLRIAQKAIKMLPYKVFLIPYVTNSGEVVFTPSLEAGRVTKYKSTFGGNKTYAYYDNTGTLIDIPKLGA